MRLSEAIRLGATLKPQGFGFGDGTNSCALQAALEAVGQRGLGNDGLSTEKCSSIWPDMEKSTVPCPQCADYHDTHSVLFVAAIHLNDRHKWSRERIAGWIETIEREQGQAAQPEAIEVEA